jgi:tetratricopeptide (TPR) repeat protein
MSVPGIVADRYLFVSSLGWCMLLGYGLFYLVERYLAKKTITDWSSVSTPARILALLPLVIYSSLTFSRNFHWKDHLTLMRKDVQYVTNSAQAHNLLALNIMKSTTEGQKTQAELDALRQEALGHFKQSFAIYPNTFNVAYDIGRVYSAMNNPDSMMVYFQKAADLDPDHQLPELSYTLAVYHQETKKYDYAIIQLQKLLKLQNTNLEAYSRLSYIHFTLGQYDQALATNRTAAFNLPTRPEPFINIAYTFQGMKNLDSMT